MYPSSPPSASGDPRPGMTGVTLSTTPIKDSQTDHQRFSGLLQRSPLRRLVSFTFPSGAPGRPLPPSPRTATPTRLRRKDVGLTDTSTPPFRLACDRTQPLTFLRLDSTSLFPGRYTYDHSHRGSSLSSFPSDLQLLGLSETSGGTPTFYP